MISWRNLCSVAHQLSVVFEVQHLPVSVLHWSSKASIAIFNIKYTPHLKLCTFASITMLMILMIYLISHLNERLLNHKLRRYRLIWKFLDQTGDKLNVKVKKKNGSGAFILLAWFRLSLICPPRRTRKRKSIQKFLWLITFILRWNISILIGLATSMMTSPPSTGLRAHWML